MYIMHFVSIEISRLALHAHCCMLLMMTNVALSLQRCVPRIQASGKHQGWRERIGNGKCRGDIKSIRREQKQE